MSEITVLQHYKPKKHRFYSGADIVLIFSAYFTALMTSYITISCSTVLWNCLGCLALYTLTKIRLSVSKKKQRRLALSGTMIKSVKDGLNDILAEKSLNRRVLTSLKTIVVLREKKMS